ncbi:MAG TPA: peptidase [Cyanobacteria bacterium UBA8553]|nr:peptidase [Cyanobacteria bacterium UBA8553]HAJ61367.1 peptidase [Cyanobacteria bacterium UBA8543]
MNLLKTVALLGFMSALLVFIGYWLIGGTVGAMIGLGIAVVTNFTSWFYSDQIALAVYGAKSLSSSQDKLLRPMVERLCYRANLPVPKIYVIPSGAANAFATGRDPKHGAIALTQGLIHLLSKDELEAVIAHELTHIKNRDTLIQAVAATIAGAISFIAQIVGQGMWFFGGLRNSGWSRLITLPLTVILAPIAATVIQMAISRTREFAADAGAAKLTGNPRALADALKRITTERRMPLSNNTAFAPLLIVNHFSGERMSKLFSTHPPTEARIQQLLNLEPGVASTPMKMKTSKSQRRNRVVISAAIALAALSLAYAPIPGLTQTVVVVSGTELQEPLKVLEAKFEQEHPGTHLELKFQGSQDMVNKYIDDKNDFKPTVLIPANGQILKELSDRAAAQGNNDPYYEPPRPIVKTQLVGIAWAQRGKVLFPDGRFNWQRIEQAMQAGNWQAVGGDKSWGSFDFVTTDPTRSNSGQLTLSLWAQSKLGGSSLNATSLNTAPVQSLLSLVKRSVYQPPRSTDILLQEFIAHGPNDADVATVYESVALSRWQQAATTQGQPYQIYYLNPTIETTSTAAIVRRDVNSQTAKAASKFLDFLTQPESVSVFVQYGFRPANGSIDLKSIPNSPWNKNIPGTQVNPVVQTTAAPSPPQITEIQRLWERVN